MHHYTDLGSATDWLKICFNLASTNQKHYPDLGSDASSVWNFCSGCSDVISRGDQWWRRKMLADFSGYLKLRHAFLTMFGGGGIMEEVPRISAWRLG